MKNLTKLLINLIFITAYDDGLDSGFASVCGATVGSSGYSNFTPGSHSKTGQQSGNGAVLLVFSDNLHFGLAFGNGPQSSTWNYRKHFF